MLGGNLSKAGFQMDHVRQFHPSTRMATVPFCDTFWDSRHGFGADRAEVVGVKDISPMDSGPKQCLKEVALQAIPKNPKGCNWVPLPFM